MRIWHVNVGNHAGRVDGVANMATRLAAAQATIGNDVHLWVVTDPAHEEATMAATDPAVCLELHPSPRASMMALVSALGEPKRRPDVIHLHSVFRPVHAGVRVAAQRAGVRIVQTTHAGLDPTLLRRDRLRKSGYRWFVERRALQRADAVVALQRLEAEDIRRFCARRGPIDVIANAVETQALDQPSWSPPPARERPVALLLSRYDVFQKGLDRVARMGELLPGVEFRVHGSQDKNAPSASRRLIESAPANVRFLPPVFDSDKYLALNDADVFLQPSRAEGVSLALTEAMTLGVPCAVSEFVDRSLGLTREGAALRLADDAQLAAAQLAAFLEDPAARTEVGRRGAGFALRHFDPTRVRDAYLAVYERVCGLSPSSDSGVSLAP
jgi:glycosyltransferase involved in cell wall biosynthesis